MWKDVKRLIHKYDRFLITTHQHPDGDGVGAATALIELLLAQGKKAQLVCDSPIPDRFAFLDFHALHRCFQNDNGSSFHPQVLIILDTHRLDRIGRLAELVDSPDIVTICIDHHVCHNPITPWTFIDLEACSVGAMVYTLYKESGFELNLQAAKGIYTSVICDTGRFSYSSTSRKAHKLADECIRLGVDPNEMHALLFQQVSMSQLKVFSQAIKRMEFFFHRRLVFQEIHHEDLQFEDVSLEDLEYFHEFNKSLKEVECSIIFCENRDGSIRISARSKMNLDVEKPMRSLGGGGHCRAAGATSYASIKEAKAKVLTLLSDLFDHDYKPSLEGEAQVV